LELSIVLRDYLYLSSTPGCLRKLGWPVAVEVCNMLPGKEMKEYERMLNGEMDCILYGI
jgi:hypothetical protein